MLAALKMIGFFIALILLIVLYNSVFVVTEGQQAIVLRLGKIVTNAEGQAKVKNPGVHFKLPFVNQVHKFDVRLQTLSMESSRILTKEQKDVLVDAYAKWRIEDVALFFKRTAGNINKAKRLLESQTGDALREEFGRRTIKDMLSEARIDTMKLLRKTVNESAHVLGIEVVDVRVKRIDLPADVSNSVFDRMRAQREQVAAEHRARGRATGEAIRAKADAGVTIVLSQAKKQAAKKIAEGKAGAAKIYADVFGRAPEFYQLYKSLKVYKDTFNSPKDILLLDSKQPFFKYLQGPPK